MWHACHVQRVGHALQEAMWSRGPGAWGWAEVQPRPPAKSTEQLRFLRQLPELFSIEGALAQEPGGGP